MRNDYWAAAPCPRDQLTLFAQRLDDAIAVDHPVRLLDEILARVDWSRFEGRYHGGIGQPPIHPRILAGVILYGLMSRIRASRSLEEALLMRIDFRWLASGHTADHTTLSEFRRNFPDELKDLFVQIGLLAVELEIVSLKRLAFDGTRIKANNRRSGSRSPERLRELQAELQTRFDELESQAQQEDAADQELFGESAPHRLPKTLADVQRRGQQIAGALAHLEQLESAGEEPPKRIPLSDPDARISPNKEGGFAPNYTPLAGVDVQSGLIVTEDVINHTHEEHHLLEAVEQQQEQFQTPPEEVLADGLFATGANLAALEEAQITMYSPCSTPDPQNPALRDDPTQPVPAEQRDQLPMVKAKNGGGEQLAPAAFIYDEEQDTYWCPQAEPLPRSATSNETREDGTQVQRQRYKAQTQTCLACPLKERCLSGKKTRGRQLSRDQFEPHRERLAQRMAMEEGRQKYADRRSPGERPFGVIKQVFGARQFLLRGLTQVKTEWRWLTTAFNLKQLIERYAPKLLPRPGPSTEPVAP